MLVNSLKRPSDRLMDRLPVGRASHGIDSICDSSFPSVAFIEWKSNCPLETTAESEKRFQGICIIPPMIFLSPLWT